VSQAPLQSYLDKWLAARPAQRVAMPYVRTPELAGHLALAALEHEWTDAAHGIREPQVAQAKLHWWAEELAGAAFSGGRHPLTQALFAAPRTGEIDLALWLAPLEAAMSQVEAATPADFAEQQAPTPIPPVPRHKL
jgi:phytoene synthase